MIRSRKRTTSRCVTHPRNEKDLQNNETQIKDLQTKVDEFKLKVGMLEDNVS